MRQKIRHTGKRALSIVLSLMMIMSTLAVGIISVEAATVDHWIIVGYHNGNSNFSWNKNDTKLKTVGSTGSITYDTENDRNTIYFKPTSIDSSGNVISVCSVGTGLKTDTEYTMTWNVGPAGNEYSKWTDLNSAGVQSSFTPSKRYVTFTFSGSGESFKLKIEEFDPAPTKITTLPTESKAKNTLIFNSSTSAKAQSSWLWTADNGNGVWYALDEVGTADSQYLSTHARLDSSAPRAIPFKQAYVNNGSPNWDNNRLTSKDIDKTSGTIIDGNYYVKFTTGSSNIDTWEVFNHIGATFSVDKAEVEPGTTVKISATADKGTLSKANNGAGNDYFTYVVKYPDGSYYRIGDANTTDTSVTFAPEAAGTYTIMGYVSDPFKFETVKATDVTLTVKAATTPLATPTLSVDKEYIGSSETAKISVDNTSAYTGKGTVTYSLYKGDTLADSNTTGSFSVSSAGTYKVKATSSDAAYTESEFSNSVTVNAKTKLPKPQLSVSPTSVDTKDPEFKITFTIDNFSSYSGATPTFTLYKVGNDSSVTTISDGAKENSISYFDLIDGANNYYVLLTDYDKTKYECAEADKTSNTAVVTKTTPEDKYYTVNFGSNNGTMGSVSAKDASNNPVSSGNNVLEGTSVTFTAAPATNYEIEGWYSDSSFANKITSAGTSTTYTATVNAATTVYVKFKEKVAISYAIVGTLGSSEVKTFAQGVKFGADNTVQITYDNNSNNNHFRIADNQGNFYGTSDSNSENIQDNTSEANAFSDKLSHKTTYDGVYPFYFNDKATYTVHIKTDANGYVSKVWVTTIKSFGLIGSNTISSNGSNASWSTNYSSSLKFDDSNKITVNVSDVSGSGGEFRFVDSSNTAYGSDSYKNVTPGTTYTTTLNSNNSYHFSEAGTYTIEITDTSSPIKFKVTKGGSSSGLCLMDNATNTKIGDFVDGTFTKNIAAGSTYSIYIKDGSTNYYASGNINDSTSNYGFYTGDAKYATFNATIGGDYTFTAVKGNSNEYKLTIVAPEQEGFVVYAKNGTVISESDPITAPDGSTSDIGKTILIDDRYKDKVTSESRRYETYRALPGESISIQTTVRSEYYNVGYRVEGFVINGETYQAVNKGEGVFRTFYKVPEDLNGYRGIQITPVYYITGRTEESAYIKVYIDASQVLTHWGNEIASFSYNYYDVASRSAYSVDGKYPGQPLLKDSNGKYFTLVPKKFRATDISGITVNNFDTDLISQKVHPEAYLGHKQSFDFNDLEYINKLGCDIAQFTIAYRPSKDNISNTAKIFQPSDLIKVDERMKGVVLANNPTADAELSWDEFDYAHNAGTGWNDLFTYDKELSSVIGRKADASKRYLRVVSCGNVQTDWGQWSTLWAVYDENRKFITYAVPSDFIERADGNNTEAYNTIVNLERNGHPKGYYADAPVKITYGGTGLNEFRADGRWTYARSTDYQATVNVGVQYADSADATVWTDDINGVDGHTGSTAYIDGKTTVTYPDRAHNGTLIANPGNGWVFHGWYKEVLDNQASADDQTSNIKTTYEFLSDELSITLNADSNYNIVARFVPVGEGAISISHSKYSGTGAQGGLGFYYVSATLYDKDNNVKETITKSDKPITLNNVTTEDTKIVVTLETTCSGDNTFLYFYEGVEGGYQIIAPEDNNWGYGEKTGTYTFEISIADIVKDNKLILNTFNFYSDIAKVSADVTLNYKYRDRFGSMVTYVVKTTLTDEEMAANLNAGKDKYYLSNDYISAHAPYIDDLYNNCDWNITDQTVTHEGTTATVVAQQNEKLVTAKVDASGDGTDVITVNDIHYNSLLVKPGTTEFFTSTAANFKYWVVYILGTENDATPKEITRCYSEAFNFRITQDCYIMAVTEDDGKTLAISEAKYTHNIYTNPDGSTSDYLYADFVVSYTGTEHILLNSEKGDEKERYRTGIVVEACFDGTNSVIDKNDIKTGTDGKIDLNQYQYTSDADAIKDAIVNGTNSYTNNSDGTTHRLKKFELDNQYYNNYNKQEYYVRYSNNDKNTTCVMKAYYYVYKIDQDGNIIDGSIELSEATYYCLYDIANATN